MGSLGDLCCSVVDADSSDFAAPVASKECEHPLRQAEAACSRTLHAHHPTSNESRGLPRVLSAKDGHEVGAQIFHRHGLENPSALESANAIQNPRRYV